MSFPLIYILYFFLVVALFFIIFSAFNIFHAYRYGMTTSANRLSLAIYASGSIALLGISLLVIFTTDWSLSIILF